MLQTELLYVNFDIFCYFLLFKMRYHTNFELCTTHAENSCNRKTATQHKLSNTYIDSKTWILINKIYEMRYAYTEKWKVRKVQ